MPETPPPPLGGPVKLSMFSVTDHHPGLPRSISTFYTEILESAALAETLGYHGIWIAEHHFHEYGVVPNPAVFLAMIARMTSRIRIGPAVSVLPFHNPVRVAEDYAILDQLSGGRLDMGVGSGYLPHEFDGMGVSGAEKRERFDEALGLLRRLWRGERVAHAGPRNAVHDITLNVLPVQKPLPPFYVAALRPEACFFVGKQGVHMMTVPYAGVDDYREIGDMIADFRRGWAESGAEGAPQVLTALHAHVAETDAEAHATAESPFNLYTRTRLYAKSKKSYDEIVESGVGLFGSVETVTEHLARLAALGVDHVMLLQDFGALPHEKVKKSMRLFAEKVVPVLSVASPTTVS